MSNESTHEQEVAIVHAFGRETPLDLIGLIRVEPIVATAPVIIRIDDNLYRASKSAVFVTEATARKLHAELGKALGIEHVVFRTGRRVMVGGLVGNIASRTSSPAIVRRPNDAGNNPDAPVWFVQLGPEVGVWAFEDEMTVLP